MSNTALSLRLVHLTVAAWDGRIPTAEREAGGAAGRDLLSLANGDTLVGAARSIAQGKAHFVTSYGTLEVPLESIASLRFACQRAPTNGTVRCCFSEQAAVTIALEKIAGETVTGTAEGIGPLTMPLGAFQRLEFNSGVQRTSDDADDDL